MRIPLIRLHARLDQAVEQIVASLPGGIEVYFLDVILAQANSLTWPGRGLLRWCRSIRRRCRDSQCDGNKRQHGNEKCVWSAWHLGLLENRCRGFPAAAQCGFARLVLQATLFQCVTSLAARVATSFTSRWVACANWVP